MSKDLRVTKHLFMIIAGASSAETAGPFEKWYVERHMPDVLAVPGFVAAQRFRLAPDPAASEAPARFLTIYEIEAYNPSAVMDEVRRRAGTDAMPLYPGAREKQATTLFAEAVTDRMVAPPPTSAG